MPLIVVFKIFSTLTVEKRVDLCNVVGMSLLCRSEEFIFTKLRCAREVFFGFFLQSYILTHTVCIITPRISMFAFIISQ